MTVIIHRPVRPEDARDLVARLRAADKLELLLAHGDADTLKALEASIEASGLECEVVVIDGVVEAVYGLSKLPEFNVPWMLGTDVVMRHPRQLITWGRAQLRYWADRYDAPLRNLVLAVNDAHVRWLKHIGCKFGEEVRIGPLNARFLHFSYV